MDCLSPVFSFAMALPRAARWFVGEGMADPERRAAFEGGGGYALELASVWMNVNRFVVR